MACNSLLEDIGRIAVTLRGERSCSDSPKGWLIGIDKLGLDWLVLKRNQVRRVRHRQLVQHIWSIDVWWRLWEISNWKFRVRTRNKGVRVKRYVTLGIVVDSFAVQQNGCSLVIVHNCGIRRVAINNLWFCVNSKWEDLLLRTMVGLSFLLR